MRPGFDSAPAGLPAGAASESVGAAFAICRRRSAAPPARRSARSPAAGFYDGLQAGCLVAAGVCLTGALMVLALLPSRPADEEREPAAGDPAPITGSPLAVAEGPRVTR